MGNGKLYNFYCNYLVNWLSGGALVNKSGLSSLGIKPLYDRIITKTSVKKVLCIQQFPVDFQNKFSLILNKKVSDSYPDCKIIISIQSFKSDLHKTVRNPDFKRKMGHAESRYLDYKAAYESLSATDKAVGKKIFGGGGASTKITKQTLDSLKDNFESYSYCNSVVANQGSLYTSYLFIEMISPSNDRMILLRDLVFDLLNAFGCAYSEIHSNSSRYLESIAPAGYMKSGSVEKEFESTLLSFENLAYLMPYESHGFIGDGSGTLMGVDMGSRSPFILNFNNSGDRQVNLFLAPSGKGKTLNCFMIAISLLSNKVHCSVIDVKGDEWVKLKPFTPLINIDISSSNGVFVNTLRLDDVVLDLESSRSFYESSINSTKSLFSIMSGFPKGSEELRVTESIISTAIIKLYNAKGVVAENPRTFKNTSKLGYSDVIDKVIELKESPAYSIHKDIITKLVISCNNLIENTSLFRGKEVTVNDIINTPLVIYSLNKNQGGGDDMLDSIRTFMVSYLDMKKIYTRKMYKLATTCFYEELQRKEEFRSLIKFICGVVTGARSSNVSVFLLCNNPSTLMDPDVQAITSNISTYIIGPLNKNDYEVLDYLGCSDIINKVKVLSESTNKYKHCFVCKFDTGVLFNNCVYTALVPPSILEKLKTRDVIV